MILKPFRESGIASSHQSLIHYQQAWNMFMTPSENSAWTISKQTLLAHNFDWLSALQPIQKPIQNLHQQPSWKAPSPLTGLAVPWAEPRLRSVAAAPVKPSISSMLRIRLTYNTLKQQMTCKLMQNITRIHPCMMMSKWTCKNWCTVCWLEHIRVISCDCDWDVLWRH